MKTNILIISITILFCNTIMVNAQKIKYKEIKPLLEGKKYDEALPKLISYYQQNTKDGAWTSKAILMEMDNMFDASKNISSVFYEKANNTQSSAYADSAIYWYDIMVKDQHPDINMANQRISELKTLKNQWMAIEQSKANSKQDNINKANDMAIYAASKAKQDSVNANREKMQTEYINQNKGVNDPMIIAKNYVDAYIKGDFKTMINNSLNVANPNWSLIESELKANNSLGEFRVGLFKSKDMENYLAATPSAKIAIEQKWKDGRFKKGETNHRLTKDFNSVDYKKAICPGVDEENINKPLIKIEYINSNRVEIRKILTFDKEENKCKYLGADKYSSETVIRHNDIQLTKVNGKWYVFSF